MFDTPRRERTRTEGLKVLKVSMVWGPLLLIAITAAAKTTIPCSLLTR
jgi:hypothetical protein